MGRRVLLSAVLSTLALCGPAWARDAVMTVKVSDLDVSRTVGAASAVRRISLAARAFCGEADVRDLSRMALVSQCRRYMATRAVAVAEAPAITAAYEGRGPATVTLAAR